MATSNKSSEVLLLLKKQGIFSKALQVEAKAVQPNLKKIFNENNNNLREKVFDIVKQNKTKNNIEIIIC